jgi:carboxyl-terminal processing protease
VLAAFTGGAVASHLAHARTQASSPYDPLDQLAGVLVLLENDYVDPAQRSKVVEGAIKGMVAELDPHSAYMNPQEYALFQSDTEGKFGGIGVEVDFKDDRITVLAPMEGSPAERAGMRAGDEIIAIDGKPMREERLDRIITRMRGPAGSRVRVTVRRAGASDLIQLDLTREIIHVVSVIGKRLDNDVAYLRLRQFQAGSSEEMLSVTGKLRGQAKAPLRGVILDMRNNPGGLVDEAEAIADEFLDGGPIYSTRHRGKIIDEAKASAGGAFAAMPIVVLVNEYSASCAELLAGALQDSGRATVVGATTFGKGSVQTIYNLPGGAGMRLTTMRYYTPSGRSIQAQGIAPDVPIEGAKPLGPGELLRESDLEGHLPAEAGGAGARPGAAITRGAAVKATAGDTGPSREVLADPTKGADFTLATGYKQLMKRLGVELSAR